MTHQLDLDHAPAYTVAPHEFGGQTYSHELDGGRLNRLMRAVWAIVREGGWWTPEEIADRLAEQGIPTGTASVTARLRDFRKDQFGGFQVDRRRRTKGTHEYRVLPGSAQQRAA